MIDQHHFRGHVSCCRAFSTGEYKGRITNSALAEQKNSILSALRRSVAYMSQPTALEFVRFVLFKLNEYEDQQEDE